ncbi:MAG: ComF family protein [Bacteroidota bacterium]|nr:ComF family protein [Bacteroidota bacterium]
MQIFQDFLSLIFPNTCFVCSDALAKGEEYICTPCRYNLPKTNYHKLANNHLQQRFFGIIDIKQVYSYLHFIKNGSVSQLLYKLKYGNVPELGEVLGKWFGKDLLEEGVAKEYDMVLPVPLHPSKLRKRGYNQSDQIAQGLAYSLELPFYTTSIIRSQKSESQTKKGRFDRWKNVENVFQVKEEDTVAGKRILLVDDVLTTGATLEACAKAVYTAGCKEVGIATLAAAQ